MGMINNFKLLFSSLKSLIARAGGAEKEGAASCYITYIGHAVEGGDLDYAGRIYMVDGQEYFVRLFDYVDPSSGRATVVVRPDGYKKIVRRFGNDNNISRMKLVDELDSALKKALRDYIAAVYRSQMQDRVTLRLG